MRPRLSRAALAPLIALGALLGVAYARADVIFCNEFGHAVNVAIAYPQTDGSFMSRGWLGLSPGNCAPFDTALQLKSFYFRGESEQYRDDKGQRTRYFWGKGRKFAMWESDNYQYYNAEQRVFRSSLEEFTQGPEVVSGAVSVTITFREGGSTMDFHDKN
jgi:hypothetical protein